jgi:hypothetical protein
MARDTGQGTLVSPPPTSILSHPHRWRMKAEAPALILPVEVMPALPLPACRAAASSSSGTPQPLRAWEGVAAGATGGCSPGRHRTTNQRHYPPSPRLWHAATTSGLNQQMASSSAGSSGHQRGCSLAPLPPPRTAFRETGRLLRADDCITSLHNVGPWTGCGPEGQVQRPGGGGSTRRGLGVLSRRTTTRRYA